MIYITIQITKENHKDSIAPVIIEYTYDDTNKTIYDHGVSLDTWLGYIKDAITKECIK
jgi:hypothetical protein